MDIVNFTPITATLGGMIIGLAVVIFFKEDASFSSFK